MGRTQAIWSDSLYLASEETEAQGNAVTCQS